MIKPRPDRATALLADGAADPSAFRSPDTPRGPDSGRRGECWDWRFLVAFGVAMLAITSLPYVYGYISSPADKQFMGLDYAVYDYAQYMSWARESADHILVENKLTSELNPPAFFNLLWWAVGRADRYLGLSFVVANQALRLVSNVLFLVVAYWFCALIFPDRTRRRYAVVLTCLSSGFGWVLVVLKQWTGTLILPTDLYTTVGNAFFGMMSVPHHIISAALLIAILGLMLRGYRSRGQSSALFAGVLALVLGLEHTYDLVTAYAVVGTFAALVSLRDGVRRDSVVSLIIFFALSAPSALFWLYLERTSAEWRLVLAQYQNLGVFTPNPPQLVILLGPTLLLALLALRRSLPLRSRSDEELFLSGWLVVNLLIIYLPVNFQIMMLNGIQVVLAVLATRELFEHVLPWLRLPRAAVRWPAGVAAWLASRRSSLLVPALFLAVVLPTNVYLLSWRFVDLGRHNYPYYLYRGDVGGLTWLDQHAKSTDVVLSSLFLGIYLPGSTGTHAFLSHGADTLYFNQKREVVAQFFDPNTPDSVRQAGLEQFHVDYVFDGPAERELGSFDPGNAPYVKAVFTSSTTRVFQVMMNGS